jgi:hypothetical protein
MSRPSERGAPILYFAFAAVLAAGIGWGIDAQMPWDVDNIAPGSVLKGMAAGFGPGWYSSYGPLPYYWTAVAYVPLLAIAKFTGQLGHPSGVYPWGFAHADFWITTLVLVARAIPLFLALLLAGALIVREVEARWGRSPWIPLALLAGSPTFVYYARTSNVDLHALFWAGLGFAWAERPRATAGALAAAAAAAVAAVCSKEQIAPFSAVILTVACARAWTSADRPFSGVRRVAFVTGVAIVTYAVLWQLPWNAHGWVAHHQFIFREARYERTYPFTPSGLGALLLACARQAPVALGWATLVGTMLGVLAGAPFRDLSARAVACVLYVGSFLVSVGYVYPRFLLPLLLLAVPYAWRGWHEAMWTFRTRPALRGAPAAALVVLAALGGPLLDLTMLADNRYRIEAILARLPDDTVVEVLGNPHFQARVPRRLALVRSTVDSLRVRPRAPLGDVVLVSAYDTTPGFLQRDSTLRAAYWDPLVASPPGGAYRARTYRSRAWSRWARGLPVDPTITVYERTASVARDTSRAAR